MLRRRYRLEHDSWRILFYPYLLGKNLSCNAFAIQVIIKLPVKAMHISRVQKDIVRIGEGKRCNSSPTLHWRHSFYDLELRVSVVMLRKIKKESRAFVAESYINSRKFIQACIMVSHGYADRHHIAQCGSDLAIHAKEVVPCIRASWPH